MERMNSVAHMYVVKLQIVNSDVNFQPYLTEKSYLWLGKLPSASSPLAPPFYLSHSVVLNCAPY